MTPINLARRPMSLEAFIDVAERDLPRMQLPKPPLWHVAQDGVARDRPGGMWLEFGTGSGATTRMLSAARRHGELYTFDSFEGLPSDWGAAFKKGDFKFDPPTDLPAHAHVVVGLFADTLGPFLAERPGVPADLVHIDCDLYESTQTVLHELTGRVEPGSVLVFDELLYYPGREHHEVRALYEWLVQTGLTIAWIGIQGKHRATHYYDLGDAHPQRAGEWFIEPTDERIVRFDVPLNERVALRIV